MSICHPSCSCVIAIFTNSMTIFVSQKLTVIHSGIVRQDTCSWQLLVPEFLSYPIADRDYGESALIIYAKIWREKRMSCFGIHRLKIAFGKCS